MLSIVLRDSLHQPQYVEKLEKIVRFMIKEKSLTLEDLDKIWDAQVTSFLMTLFLSKNLFSTDIIVPSTTKHHSKVAECQLHSTGN